jgi:hypothetical protein
VEMLVENSSLYPSLFIVLRGLYFGDAESIRPLKELATHLAKWHSDVVGLGCCVGPSNCA